MNSPCCDGCFRIDKNAISIRFCMDCEESLCHECVTAHKTIKVLTSHQLVSLNELSTGKVKYLAAKQYCNTHSEYTLDFFCSYHDAMCCHSCIPVNHRACDKILPLKEASKDVKMSALIADIFEGLKHVSKTAIDTIQNREENIQSINDQASSITGSISVFKETILNKVNEMEKSAINSLSNLKNKTISKMSDEKDKATIIKSAIDEYNNQLQFMIKNGSDNQTFVFVQELRFKLLNQDQTLDEVISKLDESSLHFTETKILGEKELGSFKVSSGPCNVKHTQIKQFGAQIKSPITRTPKKFTRKRKLEIEKNESRKDGIMITGVVADENELYACFHNSKKICRFSSADKCTGSVDLGEKPWDIAIHSKSGKIVATLRSGSLQILENMEATTKFDILSDKLYGVAWINDDLVVGGKAEIYFLDSNMEHVKTLQIGANVIYYIHAKDEKVYLSDYESDKVYCIDKEGNSIFTYSSPTLNKPDGIATDGNGNVYVVGRKSNNVHRLSPQGTECEIVLSAEDGIKDPIAICFSPDYKSLYLSNESGKSIWIFDCDY
ncbi:E3 ubiquitin-protein ligase TRIM71-like isoform X1 [Mytilus edulis]|uniref:E3 ubiquitin-protein ligase TRIM71-like isoform X1 n=1 Tax=Mytilus edulis TaxID=6550 RepID=UPI0039F137C8